MAGRKSGLEPLAFVAPGGGHWDWRNGAGQLKDMAARTLLLKLHQRGLIALPPRRQIPTNRMRCRSRGQPHWRRGDQRPLDCGLAQLGALSVHEVSSQDRASVPGSKRCWASFTIWVLAARWARTCNTLCGTAKAGRWLVWSLARRLGSARTGTGLSVGRLRSGNSNLGLVANNTRFLILPWVKVPHLASWMLGRVSRRLARDWQAKYGQGIVRCWRPLWSGSVFAARPIVRPTGWPWARPPGAPARTGTPVFKRRSKTFISIRCERDFREALQA